MSDWGSIPYIWEPRGSYACDECGAAHPPKQCGRCRLAYYCDVACQRAAFAPHHRAVCDASVCHPSLETVLRMASGTGREGSVLRFLWQDEVLGLHAASRACREAVAAHAWSDFDEKEGERSHIVGSVASWRACFPKARVANICGNKTVADADFALFAGIHTLHMGGCNQATITDAAFVHLRGIDTLVMNECNQATITDAAFVHLQGIKMLFLGACNQATITDAAFVYLRGIHSLIIANCPQITDAAMEHLRGISQLDIRGCPQIHAVSRKMLRRANKKMHILFLFK